MRTDLDAAGRSSYNARMFLRKGMVSRVPRCLAFSVCTAATLFVPLLRGRAAEPSTGADQVAAALAQKALTNSSALELLTELTTDIGPRLAGSAAEKRAADWAKRRCEELGFDKVWIETFPLEHGWVRGIEKAEVVSPSPQPLAVTALGISADDNRSRGSSDTEPLAEAGVPTATLALDMSDYFDLHHTAEDTLDKVNPERLGQSTAAYTVFAYLAAELDGDYRAKPTEPTK